MPANSFNKKFGHRYPRAWESVRSMYVELICAGIRKLIYYVFYFNLFFKFSLDLYLLLDHSACAHQWQCLVSHWHGHVDGGNSLVARHLELSII